MSLIDMSEVIYKAEGLLTALAAKPTITAFSNGDYVRWEVELFRRRYIKQKKDVEEAEAVFREACRGGTFTTEEAKAHDNALREADSRRSIARASISQLVSSARESINFAKQQDEWISNDRKSAYEENPIDFCQYSIMSSVLPNSSEEKRNKALLEAEQEYINALAEAKQEAREAGPGSSARAASRRASEMFEQRKAAIEEAFYSAYLSQFA
jgi:hypothetical protein